MLPSTLLRQTRRVAASAARGSTRWTDVRTVLGTAARRLDRDVGRTESSPLHLQDTTRSYSALQEDEAAFAYDRSSPTAAADGHNIGGSDYDDNEIVTGEAFRRQNTAPPRHRGLAYRENGASLSNDHGRQHPSTPRQRTEWTNGTNANSTADRKAHGIDIPVPSNGSATAASTDIIDGRNAKDRMNDRPYHRRSGRNQAKSRSRNRATKPFPYRMSKFSIRKADDPAWSPQLRDEAEEALRWCADHPFDNGIFNGVIILDRMCAQENIIDRPDVQRYARKLAWAAGRCASANVATQVSEIMQRVILRAGDSLDPRTHFDIIRFLMSSWVRVDGVEGKGTILDQLLDELKSVAMTGRGVFHAQVDGVDAADIHGEDSVMYVSLMKQVDNIRYNQVINALASDGNSTRAVELLEEMIRSPYVHPDRITFNTVLKALAHSDLPEIATKQAETILQLMKTVASTKTWLQDVAPDTHTYNFMFTVLRNGLDPDKTRKALALFDEMRGVPETNVFSSVALSAQPEHASSDLAPIIRSDDKYNISVPDKKTYTLLFSILSEDADNAELCEKLLLRLVRADFWPSTGIFHAVATCMVQSTKLSDTSQRVSDLYNTLQQTVPHFRGNSITQAIFIRAYAKDGRIDKVMEINDTLFSNSTNSDAPAHDKHDARTVSAVLQALSSSDQPDIGERAETIVQEMQRLREICDTNYRPNVSVYNALLKCWAHSRADDAGPRADRILQRMEEGIEDESDAVIRPNYKSYNAVLLAYANQPNSDADSHRRAIAVLDKMTLLAETGDDTMRPNANTLAALQKLVLNNKSSAGTIQALLKERHLQTRLTGLLSHSSELPVSS